MTQWALLFLAVTAHLLAQNAPTFYRDVLPVFEKHCQECHRPGEIGPLPLVTYDGARPWAKAIRDAVAKRNMPPWFADACCLKLANDRSLTQAEIDTLAHWAVGGAPPGNPQDAGPPKIWPKDGNLEAPDLTLEMPMAFAVPARGAVEYQYFIIPTHFTEDRWVQGVEVLPSVRSVVHHAVVYIRPPGDHWAGGPTTNDMLAVYAPGTGAEILPEGMARLVKAGSDLVLELHYTPNGKATADRERIAIRFAKAPPVKRVMTLQMDSVKFAIPAGDPNYRVTVSGTFPHDALLLGFFPHMHLRGKAFEYLLIPEGGAPQPLLRVSHYNFHWQMSYRLAEPLAVKQGARLSITAWFDNSANNPLNPDPSVEVHYGHQSWEEMMVGFFDVAVDAGIDKVTFFTH